jgi:hypothetical protein
MFTLDQPHLSIGVPGLYSATCTNPAGLLADIKSK